MRTRVLIGLALVLLVLLAVLVVVVSPGRSPDQAGPGPAPGTTRADPAAPPAPGAEGAGDPYFPKAGNGGYDVAGYDIQVRYDPATDRIVGTTAITARATQNLSQFDLDLKLPANAVEVNSRPATIHQDDGELQVDPAEPVRMGDTMVVRVDYAGVPSSLPRGPGIIQPWIRTPDGAVAVGQPDSAAWWYPSNDHPSDKATMTVTATVPAGVEAISGGALLGGPEPAEPGWERWRWQVDQPMATYLAFVAFGQYDLVRRDTPAGPYLAAYAQGLDPAVAAAARASVERTPEIIDFLTKLFGPYPFAQLGGVVPNAPDMLYALETQTRPVYGPIFFTGSDGSADSGDVVVVHELTHQWFGDSVSVQRWRDIWLNEGFATYAEWLYSEHTGGPSVQQIALDNYQSIPAEDGFWRVPPGDPGAEEVFDNPVYVRGAMALQALRDKVGDEDFFTALRTWVAQRGGGNGTVEDFLAVLKQVSGAQVSGDQVDDVAQVWLFQAGRPDTAP